MINIRIIAIVIINIILLIIIITIGGYNRYSNMYDKDVIDIVDMIRADSRDHSEDSIICIVRDICSICNTGAALDSLVYAFDVPHASVYLVLLGDYSNSDVRNLALLWNIKNISIVSSNLEFRVINRASKMHYVAVRNNEIQVYNSIAGLLN